MQNEQLWISIKWFKYWKFFFHVCEVISRFKPSTYFILMSGYTANIMDMVDVYDDVNDESVLLLPVVVKRCICYYCFLRKQKVGYKIRPHSYS